MYDWPTCRIGDIGVMLAGKYKNLEDWVGRLSLRLIIPNSVTGIAGGDFGNGTFYGCSGLTSVAIPDLVTSIGEVTMPFKIAVEKHLSPSLSLFPGPLRMSTYTRGDKYVRMSRYTRGDKYVRMSTYNRRVSRN